MPQNGNVTIFTHRNIDFDGATGVEKLRRFGNEEIQGINKAVVKYWNGDNEAIQKIMENKEKNEKIIFVDTCPAGVASDVENGIYVFDHHPHGDFPDETAASLVDKFLELNDSKNSEMTMWSKRADFKSGGDPMNVANLMKEMHLLFSDEEVLQWFSEMTEAHYQAEIEQVDWQKGTEFFSNAIDEFLAQNEETPARTTLQRWNERTEKAVEDKMNVVNRTAVNLSVFGPEKTRNWLMSVFRAIDRGQRLFREAAKEFEEAKKMVLGNKVVIIATTTNSRFNRFCRSEMAKRLMPRAMGKREEPIVVQFQNRGFQIFSNGSGYKLFDIVGALRAEILKARNGKVPSNWKILKQEGTLPGTEPLYYQAGTFEVVMWGSLTAPGVKSMDIARETVEQVVLTAVDQQFFPQECQEECIREKCPLYKWQLVRCNWKRKNSQK